MKIKKNSEWEILTPSGWSDFDGIKVTERSRCMKMTFDNGDTLVCTPEHRLKTEQNTFIYANEITDERIKNIHNSSNTVVRVDAIKGPIKVYDILNVQKKNEYNTNNFISHNCAHIEDHLMKDFWASVIPTISSSKKRTTKIFMVSTPRGTGNLFYEVFTKAEKNEPDNNMAWHAEKIKWNEIPGRGKLWKQDMIEALHNDKKLFEQEFNCAFIETGDSAIDKELLDELEARCRQPEQIFEDGYYTVWKPPQPDHIYGIGVDVGEGIGKAASVIQVLDFTDLTDIHQVAEYANRYVHPTKFADVINRVGHHYGCPPILIERNNIGSETIAVLKDTHHYENIVTYNPEKLSYGDIRPGILSHTNTKFNGVMNMRYWINSLKVVNIYDLATVQELKTFVRYPNGTWKKKQGENIFDDRVMALVWALFLLNDNIAERYYDIIEFDDHGKPLKLAAYVIKQPGIFSLDPFFQQTPNAPLPAFIGVNPSNDLTDLLKDGWSPLYR